MLDGGRGILAVEEEAGVDVEAETRVVAVETVATSCRPLMARIPCSGGLSFKVRVFLASGCIAPAINDVDNVTITLGKRKLILMPEIWVGFMES